MTAETERARLERARELDDTEDLEEEVTDVLGSARAGRLDPDALRSLAQCALVLGADSLTVYRATGPAFPADTDMAEGVDDAEAAIADRAAVVADELDAAEAELADAREALDNARAELADARAMPVDRPCDGCHDERRDAIAEARDAIAEARERIDTGKAAIEVLTDVGRRLRRALKLIRRVLPEVGETYETVYEHVDAGRLLPKDGDWITGADTPTAAVPRNAQPGALAAAQRLLGAALIGERAGARTRSDRRAVAAVIAGEGGAAPDPTVPGSANGVPAAAGRVLRKDGGSLAGEDRGAPPPAVLEHAPPRPERRTAADSCLYLYHVSPARNRESIRETGLDKTRCGRGPRVYLSDEEGARFRAASGGRDVWKVDVTGIPLREDRTDAPGSWYAQRSIPPQRVTLLPEDGPLTARASPAGQRHPGRCDWCGRPGERTRNRGEDLCDSCIGQDIATNGVDILMRDTRGGIPPFVYNTVRDADKVYPRNPDGIDGRDLPGPRARRARQAARPVPPPAVTQEAAATPAQPGRVVMTAADGESRDARLDPFGSYSCGFCSGVTVSPEGWAETQRANAEHYARDGETYEPQPYPEHQRHTWDARACGNPACLTSLNAEQLAVTRQRRAEHQAEAERQQRISQAIKRDADERREQEAQQWLTLRQSAEANGQCVPCLRASDWRWGRPKRVRHRDPSNCPETRKWANR